MAAWEAGLYHGKLPVPAVIINININYYNYYNININYYHNGTGSLIIQWQTTSSCGDCDNNEDGDDYDI